MHTVGVVIPAYNPRRQDLERALQSVTSQTYRHWDCVVVDDGSDEAVRLDGVRVLRQTNSGVSVARNVGIQAVSGDLIAFLDQDDDWMPEKLDRQVSFLVKQDLGMSDTDFEIVRGDKVVAHGYDDHRGSLERLLSVARMGLSTMIVRRSVLAAVGGFSPLFPHVQDWELALRIAVSGYRFRRLKQVLSTYRLHEMNATKDYWRTYLEQLAILHTYESVHPGLRRPARLGMATVRRVCAHQAVDAFRADRDPKDLLRSLGVSPAVVLSGAVHKIRRDLERVGVPGGGRVGGGTKYR
jgi:glycosyltransferase involved in cell wall biosynthesis